MRGSYVWQPGNLKLQCCSNWVSNIRFHENLYLYWVYFPSSLPGLGHHRTIGLGYTYSARPARKASGTSGRTRSSAGPGAVPSAMDGNVGLSTWRGFHLCGAWASGLQATACALTQIELWRHRDVNPCAVPGQTRGVTPSAAHLYIGFRSRSSQCVDYMRFNEKSFCFRWQETTKLMLFGNTKTSSLVILCDLRYLTGNISSVMTKHMGVQRKLHRFAYLIVQITLCFYS